MSISKEEAQKRLGEVLGNIRQRDPNQKEFLQAVEEVGQSLVPLFMKEPSFLNSFATMAEPERVLHFRVSWMDDKGKMQVNRGFRVQYSSTIGPYKGGLRLHPSVNLSIIKFLGFEQVLKNALTGLPMGGGKGGSDFDPKGKSDREVLSFCQSFMTELSRHIGYDTDVPAGDIGVGAREIGYLHGQYKRLRNLHAGGQLTGKGAGWGGSLGRPEATGYGCVYLARHVVEAGGDGELKGKKCLVSGSGNVAQFCVEKLLHFGAIPVTLSDSSGYVHEPEGFTKEGLAFVKKLKNEKRGRIKEYLNFSKTAKFYPGERPWGVKADIAFPCATQNEIEAADAKKLSAGGVKYVSEGANMPSTNEAIEVYKETKIVCIPAKAANAGGVAVSGLEMSQNSQRLKWTFEEVDSKLKGIMKGIFDQMVAASEELGVPVDYQLGANVAGFLKVAKAMRDQGQTFES